MKIEKGFFAVFDGIGLIVSRSDALMVAMDFSPWAKKGQNNARRVATKAVNRRYATRNPPRSLPRGMNPTATIRPSLREDAALCHTHSTETAKNPRRQPKCSAFRKPQPNDGGLSPVPGCSTKSSQTAVHLKHCARTARTDERLVQFVRSWRVLAHIRIMADLRGKSRIVI